MSSMVGSLSAPDGGISMDLDEVWSRAMEEYEHTTGISLKHNIRGFDTVANDISERLRQSKAGNKAKAQQIMGNAMKCLQRFGGIIAQATSVVFGPSAQCWNAISFVISAAQGFQAVLDGFAALMERCVAFLERLNVDLEAKRLSGTPFDTRLRKSTYQVIAHFFTALGRSHSLATSKRQKVKTVFKIVLFNDDAGVKDSLARMETLVRDLTDTKVSVILQDLQGLARYVRESEEEINRNQEVIKAGIERIGLGVERTETAVVQIQLDLNKKMTQEESERNLKKIISTLRLSPQESWQERHGELSSHRIAGIGHWLLQPKTTLPSWANVHRDGVKFVTLTGKSGFGKSHLTNVIIEHLLEKYPRGSSGVERAFVAYYYFQNTSDENLARCLGSIVFQFAKSDRAYSKAVAAVCSRSEGLSSPGEIWRRLVLDLKHLLQGTYFVVIDGLRGGGDDDRVKDALAMLAETMDLTDGPSTFRLFVSAQEAELASPAFARRGIANISLGLSERRSRPRILRTRSRPDEMPVDTVVDPEHSLWNGEDLVIFAKTKLAAMCEKKPYLASTLSDPALNAAMALAQGVKGNYSSLQLKLDQIEASDNAKDILTVVGEASEDPSELLLRDVDSLNDSLTSDEIQELNELLLWVSGIFETATLSFLQAALGDKSLWLAKHIPQKFYQLLRWDEDSDIVETPRSAEIMCVLQNLDDAAERDERIDRRKKPADVALQQNEIELVQRVVKTFCGDPLFDKFGFQSFFQSKAIKRNVRIEIPNHCTMHTRILRRCLESLCEGQADGDLAPLRRYAAFNFMDHLECVDLNEADRGDLRAIGRLLFAMLSEETAVHAWFNADNNTEGYIGSFWVLDTEYSIKLAQCLRHPLIEAGYKDSVDEAHRLRNIIKNSTDGWSILECVAETLAKRWFEKVREIAYYFWWPYVIMAKIWGLSLTPTMTDLQRYFDWARELHTIDISQSQWSFRTASILVLCNHDKEALDSCLEIEFRGSQDWPVLLKTAEIHSKLENHQEALDCLHKVKAYHAELMNRSQDYTGFYWTSVLMTEGKIHKQLEDYQAAETCFREILSDAPPGDAFGARQMAVTNLFELWDERKAYQQALELVEHWTRAEDASEGTASWFMRLAGAENFHKCLVSAIVNGFEPALISRSYELALSAGDARKQATQLDLLRVWHASTLVHCSTSQDRLKAFDLWQDIVENSGQDEFWWLAYSTLGLLCKHLLDDAILNGVSPLSRVAIEHSTRLESLSALDLPVIREAHEGNDDPRLALARLHILAGDSAKAKAVVLDRLRSIFDEWPDASNAVDLIDRHSRLAQTFTVLSDDKNAVASWQLLQPQHPQSDDAGGGEDALENEDLPDTVAGAQQSEDISSATEANPDDAISDMSTNDQPTDQSPAGTSDEVDEVDETLTGLEDLDSYVPYTCDGCDFSWKAIGDSYVCRHCFDVQFCAACYAKLRAGSLHATLCNKIHKHLYVPPFDRKRWEEMDSELMRVGGVEVPRNVWLDGLREQWGLRQDHIDEHKSQLAAQVQAAKVLTRWRRALLRVRAATK